LVKITPIGYLSHFCDLISLPEKSGSQKGFLCKLLSDNFAALPKNVHNQAIIMQFTIISPFFFFVKTFFTIFSFIGQFFKIFIGL